MGKNWYLHGYDIRAGGSIYDEPYTDQLAYFADFPSKNYEAHVLKNWTPNDYHRDYINLYSVGFTFKPFHFSENPWKRKLEVSHDIEYMRRNIRHYGFQKIGEASYTNKGYRYISNHLGYSPKVTLNTPAFLRRFKAYTSIYPNLRIPFSGNLYTNPDSSSVPNLKNGYEKNFDSYLDRLTHSYIEYGLGANVGLKLNLHCKWNIHFERSFQMLFSNSQHTSGTNFGHAYGFRFGLRYMYGTPPEKPKRKEDSISNPVFW
ncbi:MAG: hypothetical protein ACPGTP_04290 [Bacteroidia bacterium]